MSIVKVGLVQMTCSADVNANKQKAIEKIKDAAKQGANVICLQELFTSLYFCDVEAYENPDFNLFHSDKTTIVVACSQLDFENIKNRGEADAILNDFIPDFGTRQFLLKNLYWESPEQLAFRFNLKVFNEKIETIGTVLPFNNTFLKDTLFLRGDKSDYILDSDFETILHHFPHANTHTIPNVGHWLHAENPTAFYNEIANFV